MKQRKLLGVPEVQQGLHALAETDSSTHEDEGPAEPMDGSQDG